jgi:predicted transposase YbfD/YdcC
MSCRCSGCAGSVSPDAGVFALVHDLRDPRDPRGRQYPLGAVLLIALCALACRFDSFRAMGQWAVAAPLATLERLGLRRRGAFGLVVAPSSDTIRRVVNAVMPGGLEELLRVFKGKARVVAVDGKCLWGSRDEAGQAVMVLGAMLQDGTLAAQQKVADKSSEITGFAALLAALELQDAVVVADALHTQREHARVLVEEFGAHYAFPVKRNQPELWKACRKVPWQGVRATSRSTVRAHGRIDTRVVEVVSFAGLDFPYARQVARITRHRTVRATGKRSRETVYVITDLSSGQADPQRIGEIVQAEWGIENKIHYVRDVTWGCFGDVTERRRVVGAPLSRPPRGRRRERGP